MGRSTVATLPPAVRRALDRWIKDGRLTLDQMTERLRAEYGPQMGAVGATPPSRSALGRYAQQFNDTVREARELREVARGWVSELGEAPDGDVGRMLVELVQSLTARTLLAQRDGGELGIEQLWEYARTINRIAQSDAITTRRAEMIERRARERLIEEQQQKLDEAGKQGIISPETLKRIRQQVYGLDA